MTKIKTTIHGQILGIFSTITAFLMTSFPASAKEVLGQPYDWQLGFQTAASPMKERMEAFHDHLLLPIAVVVSVFVMGLLLYVMIRFNAKTHPTPSQTTHNTLLEIIWTALPVLILLVVVVPSMKLLYFADKTTDAEMTLKAIGHQWYWEYEYPDNGAINFSANLVPEKDLQKGQVRLLSTDNPVVLPVDTNIRILVTATDVLHAFAVPAFGVKIDANPGKVNETWVRIDKEGTFYGQCSELCGQGHGFMPIEIRAVSKKEFAAWVAKQGGTMPVKAAAK